MKKIITSMFSFAALALGSVTAWACDQIFLSVSLAVLCVVPAMYFNEGIDDMRSGR